MQLEIVQLMVTSMVINMVINMDTSMDIIMVMVMVMVMVLQRMWNSVLFIQITYYFRGFFESH